MIRRTPGFIASFACLLASLVFAQSFGPLHPSSAQKKHRDQNTQDEEQIDYRKVHPISNNRLKLSHEVR